MKRTLATLLFVAACSGPSKKTTTVGEGTGEGTGVGTGDGTGGDTTKVDPALAARQAFQNPGGMWMPRQMQEPAQADLLRSLGLEIDPAGLSDPTKAPLAAVVSIPGCTASFVSPDGLVITNHHCVQGALQLNSDAAKGIDLVENGFLAKTMAEELPAGPTQKVWVAQKLTDITKDIRDGLDAIEDGKKRHDEIEKREKALIKACEQDRPEVKCKTSSFFKGAEWQLIEYLEIRDVRLVYVPHRSVGNYGGEIDNWAWPRHTGDYSFFRAYVGPDGKPADPDPKNVPFKPASYLKIATDLGPSDLVMVTGYPGRTNRHQTAAELRRAMEWSHPHYLEKAREKMELLAALQKTDGNPETKADDETAIKAGVARQGVQNGLEKYEGILSGLQDGTLIAQKEADEAAFRAWIAEDASRAKYGEALDAILAKLAEQWKAQEQDEAVVDVIGASRLFGNGILFVRWAEERAKKDEDRKLGYQDRDYADLVKGQQTFAKRHDRAIDRAYLRMMLLRAANSTTADTSFLPTLLGVKKGAKIDAKLIDKTLDGWYGKTKLEDLDVRMKLLGTKSKDLAKSKDPFVKASVYLAGIAKKMEERDNRWYGELATLWPVYAEGLLAFKGGMVAPDANSTLRISYGTVRGYRPEAGAAMYDPFTTASQILDKDKGEDPFDAPKPLLDALKEKNWGPYAAEGLGEVPVDFLSDLDITGGNSGSPMLNARGELVGLAFDGNYEGLASDVVFKGENTRTIALDIRYMLWVADAVDQADNIVSELGFTPSL